MQFQEYFFVSLQLLFLINLKIVKNVLFGNEIIEFEKSNRKEEFLASRFAAKEAFAKALGTGFRNDLNFKDIDTETFKLFKEDKIEFKN